MKRGPTKVDARLDLHGYTIAAAYQAVTNFLEMSHFRQLKCIEIVTGRGDPERGTGALRREVPLWLETPALRKYVSSTSWPIASRGGTLQIMLQRNKTKN